MLPMCCLVHFVLSYLYYLFVLIIFFIITINHRISSISTDTSFSGNVRQKFSLRVLLSFCLIFGQFQPGVACKSVAFKKACNSLAKRSSFRDLFTQANYRKLQRTVKGKLNYFNYYPFIFYFHFLRYIK